LAAANQHLARANQLLEQFAYSAAHALQDPLRKIRIFSQLLQSKLGDSLDQESAQYLSFCIQGAEQMERLIHDLLRYANSTKSAERPRNAVSLGSALDKSIATLEVEIARSGAIVSGGPLPAMYVDELRIQQLFQNLIGNAIKYRRRDVPPRVEVSACRQDGWWIFSVSDNGIGISEEYWERVFELFKRLDPGRYPGTGLGLAICKQIVEQFGGSIWVESALGAGSTFKFRIPAILDPDCGDIPDCG
jgi:light-regulated signal transduction histidine kinase (bacteriophytochrome)